MQNESNFLEKIRYISTFSGENFSFKEEDLLAEFHKKEENQSSITIKILTVLGAFIATLAFIGFMLLMGLYDSEVGLIITGILAIALSVLINKKEDSLLADTFSISCFLAGVCMFAIGLSINRVDEDLVILIVMFLGLLSLIFIQNYMHSFISFLLISGGFLTLIISNDAYNYIHIYLFLFAALSIFCFLYEAKLLTINKKIAELYYPIRISILFSFLFGLIGVCKKGAFPLAQNYIWISSIASSIGIIYLVYQILRITKIESKLARTLVFGLTALILLPIAFAPAISGAILIILLCFLVNYRTGFVLGIVALIYFVSQYYYDLNFTLLTKSILLFVSGILFLLLFLFVHKNLKSDEKI